MPLSAGDKLGHYEVVSLLGQGGMGEVYRARDTTLKRDVALKVLPGSSLRDPERLARFQREAEVLASLDHPNIGPIYGLVDSPDSRTLVLALIEGPTLADRIESGPLPHTEAIALARQIIEALEYAHDRGVVHRDLKPANIKITSEGVVKVLDFGLAKVLDEEPPPSSLANSPTLTLGHTHAGVILGTAAYMSPEQAVGRPADRRSDIFSFGAVLYEMLTGKHAFPGATTPDVLEAVVKNDPDWSALPATTPPYLRKLLERTLVKDRKQRLQAIGEARIALDNVGQVPDLPVSAQVGDLRHRWTPWVAAGVMTAVAAAALLAWLKPQPPAPDPVVMHFTEAMPPGPTDRVNIAISRDGSRLAYTASAGPRQSLRSPVYLRTMDQTEAKPLPGSEGALTPAFSPDGQWLTYFSLAAAGNVRQLNKLAVNGGPALPLATGNSPRGSPWVSWGDDGNILFPDGLALKRVSSAGGQPETLLTADAKGEWGYIAPQLLPGGRSVLLTVQTVPNAQADTGWRIAALDLQSGKLKVLAENAGIGWFAPARPGADSGYIVYVRDTTTFAIPFDARRLQAGPAFPVLNGVQYNGQGGGAFGVSDTGTLAYLPGRAVEAALSTLVWMDRKGNEQTITAPARNYIGSPRISPDGERVAFSSRASSSVEIWVYDLVRGSSTRIAAEGNNATGAWTPDSRSLLYSVQTGGFDGRAVVGAGPNTGTLLRASADGSGSPTVLVTEGPLNLAWSVSRDNTIIGVTIDRGPGTLWVMPLTDRAKAIPGKPETFLSDGKRTGRNSPQFSPDGRWVAYQSRESGRDEVYVVPYPGPGERVTISTEGGTAPRWARNGRELFYRNGDKMMAVDIPAGPAFRPGKPHLLFEKPGQYDVAPDGRFLMIKAPAAPPQPDRPPEMHIIVNWLEEVRRRAPR